MAARFDPMAEVGKASPPATSSPTGTWSSAQAGFDGRGGAWYSGVVEGKKDRTDFVKFFLRLAEIAFLVLIATPSTLLILKGEVPLAAFAISLAIGVVMILLFLLIAYKIWKG